MSETMDGKNNLEKDYSCSIENYIRGDAGSNYSICREERQYVVFLYNILRKYHAFKDRSNNDEVHKIITKACGIPEKADIECVFYEATFMRDFFERNRRIHWEGSSEKNCFRKSFLHLAAEF
ncbi:MAG TPA: hypothetical protein DCZ91_05370 [Lachnospiraceae bacterium]|nr:hypothetical protein [Lachnospiraceae bacterium]